DDRAAAQAGGPVRQSERASGMKLSNRSWAVAAVVAVLFTLPWWSGDLYKVHLAALICTYWVLISGLNLVVGYSGQLSIGHVGLLAIGAYSFAILAGTHGMHPAAAIAASRPLCALARLRLALRSLRLPGFYFAMATLAFALIVTEITLAQGKLTGGGVGL